MAHRTLILRRAALAAGLAAAALAAQPAPAQLSPGDLSRAHATLEGSTNCQRCHSRDRGVSGPACLACHTKLAARIATGHGLHARPDFARCEVCHIEHQGRGFALIDWGTGGEARFDHSRTGYALAGAHARLTCRQCHVARPASPVDGTSASSYLGLASDCATCHRDEHRGQFAGAACLSCHGMAGWKPAAAFDHARSAFPLAGKHAVLACAACHPRRAAAAGEPAVVQYRPLAHGACGDCHKDPHAGHLGARCETCHGTASWQPAEPSAFDHARTRFALAGKHRAVACAACHGPAGGEFRKPAFARCSDCHRDAHFGQFAARTDRGACESCHTVAGWRPSSYTAEAHQASRYPLGGAHLAVPCVGCHAPVAVGKLVAGAGKPGETTPRFRWPDTRCLTCHADPHVADLRSDLAGAGCEGCHDVAAWTRVRFDHGWTKFPLRGKHAQIACASCHRPETATGQPGRLQLQRPGDCAACHRDPHAGQFPGAGCTRCHGEDDWHRLRFDHQRDSRYKLDGAHAKLACAACHRAEDAPGKAVVRYKPLPIECRGCHAAAR